MVKGFNVLMAAWAMTRYTIVFLSLLICVDQGTDNFANTNMSEPIVGEKCGFMGDPIDFVTLLNGPTGVSHDFLF
jgi:hypothetical protein